MWRKLIFGSAEQHRAGFCQVPLPTRAALPAILAFLTSVLYGQSPTPGLVFVQAGALGCGAVLRSADMVQTYCYAPDHVTLVHNAIDKVYTKLVAQAFEWCVNPPAGDPPCAYVIVEWEFTLSPTGSMSYIAAANGSQLASGTFTGVYGGPLTGCAQVKVPWTGTATNWDGDRVPAMIYTVGIEQCRHWWVKDRTGGWFPRNECGLTIVNTFTLCSG